MGNCCTKSRKVGPVIDSNAPAVTRKRVRNCNPFKRRNRKVAVTDVPQTTADSKQPPDNEEVQSPPSPVETEEEATGMLLIHRPLSPQFFSSESVNRYADFANYGECDEEIEEEIEEEIDDETDEAVNEVTDEVVVEDIEEEVEEVIDEVVTTTTHNDMRKSFKKCNDTLEQKQIDHRSGEHDIVHPFEILPSSSGESTVREERIKIPTISTVSTHCVQTSTRSIPVETDKNVGVTESQPQERLMRQNSRHDCQIKSSIRQPSTDMEPNEITSNEVTKQAIEDNAKSCIALALPTNSYTVVESGTADRKRKHPKGVATTTTHNSMTKPCKESKDNLEQKIEQLSNVELVQDQGKMNKLADCTGRTEDTEQKQTDLLPDEHERVYSAVHGERIKSPARSAVTTPRLQTSESLHPMENGQIIRLTQTQSHKKQETRKDNRDSREDCTIKTCDNLPSTEMQQTEAFLTKTAKQVNGQPSMTHMGLDSDMAVDQQKQSNDLSPVSPEEQPSDDTLAQKQGKINGLAASNDFKEVLKHKQTDELLDKRVPIHPLDIPLSPACESAVHGERVKILSRSAASTSCIQASDSLLPIATGQNTRLVETQSLDKVLRQNSKEDCNIKAYVTPSSTDMQQKHIVSETTTKQAKIDNSNASFALTQPQKTNMGVHSKMVQQKREQPKASPPVTVTPTEQQSVVKWVQTQDQTNSIAACKECYKDETTTEEAQDDSDRAKTLTIKTMTPLAKTPLERESVMADETRIQPKVSPPVRPEEQPSGVECVQKKGKRNNVFSQNVLQAKSGKEYKYDLEQKQISQKPDERVPVRPSDMLSRSVSECTDRGLANPTRPTLSASCVQTSASLISFETGKNIRLTVSQSLEKLLRHTSKEDCQIKAWVRPPSFYMEPKEITVRATAKQVKDGSAKTRVLTLQALARPAKTHMGVGSEEADDRRKQSKVSPLVTSGDKPSRVKWVQKQVHHNDVILSKVPLCHVTTPKVPNARQALGLDKLRKYNITVQCKAIERIKVSEDEFPGIMPPKFREKWLKIMAERKARMIN